MLRRTGAKKRLLTDILPFTTKRDIVNELWDAISLARRNGWSMPAIADMIYDKTGVRITPAYLCNIERQKYEEAEAQLLLERAEMEIIKEVDEANESIGRPAEERPERSPRTELLEKAGIY
jgi:hypothetical protein